MEALPVEALPMEASPGDVPAGLGPEQLQQAFAREHERRYGYSDPAGELGVRRNRGSPCGAPHPGSRPPAPSDTSGPAPERREIVFAGERIDSQVFRGEPPAGRNRGAGAVGTAAGGTLLVPPGWSGEVDGFGNVLLEREGAGGVAVIDAIELDWPPVHYERRAKRWPACSCARRTPRTSRSGGTAPPPAVRRGRRDGDAGRGDSGAPGGDAGRAGGGDRACKGSPGVSWILNDPFAGGTHLPDITVITPPSTAPAGGLRRRMPTTPTSGAGSRSMPADSRSLQEEGVVIAPQVLDEDSLVALTSAMRQPRERRADLLAQLAADRVGCARLSALAGVLGPDGLREATDAVLDYCERRTRACLAALPDGDRSATDVLEAAEADLALKLRAQVQGDIITLSLSKAMPRSTRGTSTARSPSPARPACSRCGC